MLEDPTPSRNQPNTIEPGSGSAALHGTDGLPAVSPGTPGSGTELSDTSTRPIPEPQATPQNTTQATIQTNGKAKPAQADQGGYGFGQIFMVGLTLVGIVLVAQGLRRKSVKPQLKNEFSEIDAIRRELAAKYPVEPRPKPVQSSQQVAQGIQAGAALQELADRLSSQLDSKAARIEALLTEVDQRITELKTLGAAAQEAPLARLAAEGHRQHRAAPAVDPLHQRVYDMSDAGMTPVDIARSVQQPTGHVELILNLRAAAQGTVRKIGV